MTTPSDRGLAERDLTGRDLAERDLAPAGTPPRRPWYTRLSAGHLVRILAAVLAGVANFAVLRAQDDTVPVLVAGGDATAGATATDVPWRVAEIRADADVAGTLVAPSDRGALDGFVLATDLADGAPLRRTDLQQRAADDGLRRMSLPVPAERAAGGAIATGDRIDVIQVIDGTARYVVSGADVLDVGTRDTSALGGLGGFHLTIAVTPEAALCLAEALDAGTVSVLLATGQTPVPTEPCARAPASAAAADPDTAGGGAGGAHTGGDAAGPPTGAAGGERP